jgi:hypothetical protein
MGIPSDIRFYLSWSRSPFGRVFYRGLGLGGSRYDREGRLRPAVSKAAVAAVHKDPRYFYSLFEMGEMGIAVGEQAQIDSEYIDRSARELVDEFYLLMRSKKPLPGRVKRAEHLLAEIFGLLEYGSAGGLDLDLAVWKRGEWPHYSWFDDQGVDEDDEIRDYTLA